MSRRHRTVFAAAAVFVVASGARAADYPPPLPPIVEKAPFVVEEFVSGWYLRGDLGYRLNSVGAATPNFGAVPDGSTIDNSYWFGGGGGYKSGWFRADVTLDYASKPDYTTNIYRAQIGTFTALGNVYLDLGTWSGLTPYIGAGVGGAYLSVHEFVYPGGSLLEASESRWNFAWAAMGGFAYRVNHNWLVDVGYRYLDLGDAISPLTTATVPQLQLTIRDMTAHEFRIGVRYNLQ